MSTALGTVVLPVKKWNPRKSAEGTITYIDLSSVDRETRSIAEPSLLEAADAPSRARQLVSSGDVLVSTVRPNLNAVAVVPPELDGATASTGFAVLRPKADKLTARYLFHWVKSPGFVADMVRKATGASYPAVSDKIVKASRIPLPPIEEQRRIAAVLDATDELRAKRREALAKLDTLTQAIFIDMFGEPASGQTPLVPLEQVVGAPVTRGIDQPGPDVPGGVPYLKTTDFGEAKPRREALARASEEIASKFPRSVVSAGDTVICIRATVGPTMYVTEELAGVNLSRGTARVSPSEEVLPRYLFTALKSRHFQRQIHAKLRGATFLQIPLKELKQLRVPLPSLVHQCEFVEIAEAVEAQLDAAQHGLASLGVLFASLQQRAFRGEL
jgi:type I restriction enzyme, S subunit